MLPSFCHFERQPDMEFKSTGVKRESYGFKS